jgi:uncharacterized membrane protein YcjF (UPF0283 family)
MQACDSCNVYFGELSRLKESLDEQKFEVLPGELDDITFEKITQQERPQPKKSTVFSGFRRWAWVPAAVVAIIVILAVIPQFSDWVATIYQQDESSGIAEIIDEYAMIESYDDLALVVVSLLEDDTDFDRAAEEMMTDMHYDDLIDDLTDDELKALYDRIETIKGSAG